MRGNGGFLAEAIDTFQLSRFHVLEHKHVLLGATLHTSYSVKSLCTLTHVYSAKQARAMVHLIQLNMDGSCLSAVPGDVEMIAQIASHRKLSKRQLTWKDTFVTGANDSVRNCIYKT